MTEAKKDYRTISVTNMPKKVLEAFLGGDLNWEETYAKYPGPDYYIVKGDIDIIDTHNPNNSRPKDNKWTR